MTDAVVIEAVVQVGAHETRYLRCGRGEKVVVVLARTEEERVRMMRPLVHGHRVIAPEPPAWGGATGQSAAPDREGDAAVPYRDGDATASDREGDAEGSGRELDAAAVDAWLRSVLDGLGIERPALVLAPDLVRLAGRISCCDDLSEPGVMVHEPC